MISINKEIAKLYRQYKKVIDPSFQEKSQFSATLRADSPVKMKTQESGNSYIMSNIRTSKLSPGLRTNKKSSFKTSKSPKKDEK